MGAGLPSGPALHEDQWIRPGQSLRLRPAGLYQVISDDSHDNDNDNDDDDDVMTEAVPGSHCSPGWRKAVSSTVSTSRGSGG